MTLGHEGISDNHTETNLITMITEPRTALVPSSTIEVALSLGAAVCIAGPIDCEATFRQRPKIGGRLNNGVLGHDTLRGCRYQGPSTISSRQPL